MAQFIKESTAVKTCPRGSAVQRAEGFYLAGVWTVYAERSWQLSPAISGLLNKMNLERHSNYLNINGYTHSSLINVEAAGRADCVWRRAEARAALCHTLWAGPALNHKHRQQTLMME